MGVLVYSDNMTFKTSTDEDGRDWVEVPDGTVIYSLLKGVGNPKDCYPPIKKLSKMNQGEVQCLSGSFKFRWGRGRAEVKVGDEKTEVFGKNLNQAFLSDKKHERVRDLCIDWDRTMKDGSIVYRVSIDDESCFVLKEHALWWTRVM